MLKQIIAVSVLFLFVLAHSGAWAQSRVILDTGDPAERVCNPKSYTDLGNGIIRDNVTGLEWQKATAPGTYTWQQAIDYCSSLTLGGHSDWRLPTIVELSTLIDYERYDFAIDPIFNNMAGSYWSSTPGTYNNHYAWYVDFRNGRVQSYNSSANYVRAVRGRPLQTANNFVDNGDGTLTDTAIGLMWQKATASGKYTWQAAIDYCSSLTLGGYSDWRLPTMNELQSLIDYSRYNPATTFPDTMMDNFWSSTTFAESIDSTAGGWHVYFYSGEVGPSLKGYDYFVRAVRGGACQSRKEVNSFSELLKGK